jgi:hypothetical protein
MGSGTERDPLIVPGYSVTAAAVERRLWYVADFFCSARTNCCCFTFCSKCGYRKLKNNGGWKFALRQPIDALNKDDLRRHKRGRCENGRRTASESPCAPMVVHEPNAEGIEG